MWAWLLAKIKMYPATASWCLPTSCFSLLNGFHREPIWRAHWSSSGICYISRMDLPIWIVLITGYCWCPAELISCTDLTYPTLQEKERCIESSSESSSDKAVLVNLVRTGWKLKKSVVARKVITSDITIGPTWWLLDVESLWLTDARLLLCQYYNRLSESRKERDNIVPTLIFHTLQ